MEPSGLAFGKPKDTLREIRGRYSRIPLRSMRATMLSPWPGPIFNLDTHFFDGRVKTV